MTKRIKTKQCYTIRQYKESAIEQSMISEVTWQKWQSSYAALRTKVFLDILETGEKGSRQ